jgi:cell division protease FtsH
MKDRRYEELPEFPIHDSDPAQRHAKEGRRAVELAHKAEIGQIVSHLNRRQSVLVVGCKALAPYVRGCLEEQLGVAPWEVTCNVPPDPRAGNRPPMSVPAYLTQELATQLSEAQTATPPPVVMLRHLDLMTWTAVDQPRHELNDVVYWLTELADVVKLAFWDPAYPLPKIIEDLFPNRVSLQIFSREVLWQLVAPEEARKMSPSPNHFTLASQLALYQYLSGTHVVDVRRILRSLPEQNLPDCRNASDVERVFQRIRERTSSSAAQSIGEHNQPAGYEQRCRRFARCTQRCR